MLGRTSVALLVTIFFFYRKISVQNLWKASKKDSVLIIIRSFAHYAGTLLWVTAVPMTKLFTVAIIDSIPYSAILGWLLMRENFNLKKLLWTATTCLGVILISLKPAGGNITIGLGEILLVLSGLSLGFRMVSVRWHHQKLNNWELTSVIFLIATVLFGTTLFVRGDSVPSTLFLPGVILLTFLGGIINLVNLYFTHTGYRRIEAVLAGNILQLEILFGLILGFVIFSELPNIREIIGSAVLLFSIYKINKLYKE
ncbi:MAG: Membrane protein [Candidatus Gottesmanbacteria bacterium GW2011_GWA2_42_18]|nr:MAG: Membrane protein [Candidatus Gottesmanbacteria bacterium GW2011_GWA2_42_18]